MISILLIKEANFEKLSIKQYLSLMTLKTIKINSILTKLALLSVCLILSLMMFFFAKWCFANAISTQSAQKEVSEFAVSLAPDDPQTHYALAVLNEKTFLSEDLERSLAEYELATALSPFDYRLWLALGKARERNGNASGAEAAFRKSLELAPNYAQIHWALGNFLLRQGRTDEAFTEIRRAAEGNETFLRPAVSTAWQNFAGNLSEIKKLFGNSPVLNSMLAAFLANEKRFDEALEIWNSLPLEDRKTIYKEEGKALFTQMIAAKKVRDALEIFNQIAAEGEETFVPEQIANGGFERDVKPKNAPLFDWQLGDGLQPQIGFDDAQKSEGQRSIVIVFNSADGRDFRNLSQLVVVEPNKNYELSFFYNSDLKTSATFSWQIADSANTILAETEPLAEKSDWTKITLKFTTPADAEAVNIKLARVKCPQGICPITGKIRFDDFQLR